MGKGERQRKRTSGKFCVTSIRFFWPTRIILSGNRYSLCVHAATAVRMHGQARLDTRTEFEILQLAYVLCDIISELCLGFFSFTAVLAISLLAHKNWKYESS